MSALYAVAAIANGLIAGALAASGVSFPSLIFAGCAGANVILCALEIQDTP